MALSKGDRLGPYEILDVVGKGGMGEVYRAHDERLGRDVAIKVSNAEFTERFTREARAIASLNHTNVCHLYDVGPNYLVMEYVEGEDLQGPLDFDAALPIIRQLIDGIEAAHEKNIIHRDLKPANIKITHDGVVKILDFGLAKASDLSPSDDSPSGDPGQSPTLTIGATVAGTILGTAAYMSPEQAKGKHVDKRSDIFSFGVVLYELLTGRNPFHGETVVESLGAVLNKNPDWAPIPARAERLLSWCLEKDRRRRLASISDARRVLDEPFSQVQIQKEPASKVAWLAAGVPGVALAALVAWSFFTRPAPAAHSGNEAVRFTLPPPKDAIFTGNRAGGAQVAVSPDGRYVAFVADPAGNGAGGAANRVLWVRALGSLAAQRLDKTDGATDPFWSPDSKNIAFFAEGKLKRIAVSGGSPINLSDAENDEGGTWFQQEGADGKSDGVILFTPDGASPIQRVPATGGVSTPVTKLANGEITHRYPQFLPDGKRFLYHARSRSGKTGIYVQQLGSDQRTFLMETVGRARFAPPDFLLYMRDSTLLAQHIDWTALKPVGEPATVTDEVRGGGGIANGRNAFSVSDTGILAYRAGASGVFSYRWYTRDGKQDGPALGGEGADNGPIELSPDNKRAIFQRRAGGNVDLWMMEFPSGVVSRLTSDSGELGDFVWSPDSRRIAFMRSNSKAGKAGIYQMVIGTGKDSLVYADDLSLEAWIRDGLLVRSGSTVSLLPAPDENAAQPIAEKPRVLLDVKYSVDQFSVSTDGKWIAYRSSESSEPEVWVATFPAFTGRRKVSSGLGIAPFWRADGKELFFGGDLNNILSVDVKNGATFDTSPPKQILSPPGAAISSGTVHLYAVATDGKRFLVRGTPNAATTEVEPLYVILNWPALLGK